MFSLQLQTSISKRLSTIHKIKASYQPKIKLYMFLLIVCYKYKFKSQKLVRSIMNYKQKAFDQQKKNTNTSLRRPAYLDNFVVQSRAFLERIDLQRFSQPSNIKQKEQNEDKNIVINGVNYFQNQIIYHKDVEVLADCAAVRGDHFYLKKGDIIRVNSVICQYAQVIHRGFRGYFPCSFFNINLKGKDSKVKM